MHKAVFFDRDGVINSDEGHYYIYKLEDFKWNDNIIANLKSLFDAGFLIVIISNQGGIAKGIYTKKDTDAIHCFIKEKLHQEGIELAEIYYCPHHEQKSKCLCRKPNSLLIEKAIARFDIDPKKSFLVGDSSRDIVAGERAGIKGILVAKNSDIKDTCKMILNHNQENSIEP